MTPTEYAETLVKATRESAKVRPLVVGLEQTVAILADQRDEARALLRELVDANPRYNADDFLARRIDAALGENDV